MNSWRTASARLSDSLSLYSSLPTVSVLPVTTTSAALRREISLNTSSNSAFEASVSWSESLMKYSV